MTFPMVEIPYNYTFNNDVFPPIPSDFVSTGFSVFISVDIDNI